MLRLNAIVRLSLLLHLFVKTIRAYAVGRYFCMNRSERMRRIGALIQFFGLMPGTSLLDLYSSFIHAVQHLLDIDDRRGVEGFQVDHLELSATGHLNNLDPMDSDRVRAIL